MEFIIVLLIVVCGVLLADILAHFFPIIATPIIQIAIGVGISFIPIAAHFEIEHEYFHMIFVAPLAYFGGMTIKKAELWKMKGTIANMAILLVIISGVVVGLVLHSLIPAISIVASITLMASLGPTDHIAVDTVERHSHIPHTLMELLKNESVFAEVTSVVFFATGLTILTGEHFSIGHSIWEFVWEAGGGIVVGFVLGMIKLFLVRFLCAHGIKVTSLHTLIGVIFPLIAFILAEEVHVSGILAIFIAGIIASFEYKEGYRDAAQLNLGAKNIWSFLSFTLDGMVFVLLGMQIPEIFMELINDSFEISIGWAIVVILIISACIFAMRFIWAMITLPKKIYQHDNITRLRASLLFSMSGARGAITWATISSIPAIMSNGEAFPFRDVIIVISMGVIIVSVLISYVVLPIIAPIHKSHLTRKDIDLVNIDILNGVADQLEMESTSENQVETNTIAFRYRDRADDIMQKNNMVDVKDQEVNLIAQQIISWKIENIKFLERHKEITSEAADYYIGTLDESRKVKKKNNTKVALMSFFGAFKIKKKVKQSTNEESELFVKVLKSNTEFVIKKLEDKIASGHTENLENALQKYQFKLAKINHLADREDGRGTDNHILNMVEKRALEIEKGLIQDEFEEGNLPYDEAKRMKSNVSILELQLD